MLLQSVIRVYGLLCDILDATKLDYGRKVILSRTIIRQ